MQARDGRRVASWWRSAAAPREVAQRIQAMTWPNHRVQGKGGGGGGPGGKCHDAEPRRRPSRQPGCGGSLRADDGHTVAVPELRRRRTPLVAIHAAPIPLRPRARPSAVGCIVPPLRGRERGEGGGLEGRRGEGGEERGEGRRGGEGRRKGEGERGGGRERGGEGSRRGGGGGRRGGGGGSRRHICSPPAMRPIPVSRSKCIVQDSRPRRLLSPRARGSAARTPADGALDDIIATSCASYGGRRYHDALRGSIWGGARRDAVWRDAVYLPARRSRPTTGVFIYLHTPRDLRPCEL